MCTPANGAEMVAPVRSHATAERRNQPRATGGTYSASLQPTGVNQVSRSSCVICEREYGRPWPNGVVSMRAHSPRRFGTTASSRPPPASTRHTSRSSARGVVRHLQRVHQQHAVDRRILQRQIELVDQRGQARPLRRPPHHPLHGRHEGEAPLRLLAEQSEIGRRVADAEHADAAGIGKARTDAAADEAPRRHAQPLGVEIAQIDDVDGHGAKIARISVLPYPAFLCQHPRKRMIR